MNVYSPVHPGHGMNSVMRAADTYSWLNSFAENDEEGSVSSRRSTPSLSPVVPCFLSSIHYVSHRINERERRRETERPWLPGRRVCNASLAIDFKADRPSVLGIKHEERIFHSNYTATCIPVPPTWPPNPMNEHPIPLAHCGYAPRRTRVRWLFNRWNILSSLACMPSTKGRGKSTGGSFENLI